MASFTDFSRLGVQFLKALDFAARAHQMQIRKQGEIPYISHLMSVSALVLEAGGDEDEAIAALLHDVIEDIGISADRIADLFGSNVSQIVLAVSAETNDQYVDQISGTSLKSAILVSAADKLHNLRGYATSGRVLWKSAHADFYRHLLPVYDGCDRVPRYWIDEISMLLFEIEHGNTIFLVKEYLSDIE